MITDAGNPLIKIPGGEFSALMLTELEIISLLAYEGYICKILRSETNILVSLKRWIIVGSGELKKFSKVF